MYFIVDNSNNVEKRAAGTKSEFWDDCGAWKHASCPTALFIQKDDKLVSVIKRKGQYCLEKMVQRKRVYTPCEPQPHSHDLLEVRKTYQTLKAPDSQKKKSFKRRISRFGNIPAGLSFIPPSFALVEYIGTFPPRRLHGNVKNPDAKKLGIKTKPTVREELKEHLKHNSAKTVERQMNAKTSDDFEKQRDSIQLKNLKYNIERKGVANSNAADHVIAVEELTKTHDFVQNVQHMKGINHPVVTLYNEQQMTDIKRFCCRDKGSVLGIDKTYNLGEFHVTTTVYKDLSVVRRSTMDHPICFGPTFIHTSSTTKAYSAFLTK